MKSNITLLFLALVCFSANLLNAQIDRDSLAPRAKDQVIADDLIVQGSECVGFDCTNGESFGFATIKLKENNLRILFEDTSVGSFPTNDWQLTANESSSGGRSCFFIEDITGATQPFFILAGAPTNSLYVHSDGNIGIGNNAPQDKLHISGGLTVAGDIQVASDSRLKYNIKPFTGALDLLGQLQPKSYFYRTEELASLGLPAGLHHGLIAQEVERVMPELVRTHSEHTDAAGVTTTYKGVNYNGLIPVLIKGMQEQQMQIEAQRAHIAALEAQVKKLESLEAKLDALTNSLSVQTAGRNEK
jgi:hypothetical protein